MQLRLSFFDTSLEIEDGSFTGVFMIDFLKKEMEFNISLYSKEENIFYEIKNEKIAHKDFNVKVDSVYMKQDGTFTLTLVVNDVTVYYSHKILVFAGLGTFMINSNRGFHYDLMMNEEEIKKVYDELSKDRESIK